MSDGNGGMEDKIYLSFTEAENVAKSSSSGVSVKVITLDQVLYPLILNRGDKVKTSKNTPVEIRNARESISAEGGATTKKYSIVPSKAALGDAKGMTLKDGDIPLFVVERLAFASNEVGGGAQLPLFTERDDAITSYNRLREGGSKLPEEPIIRTTSLLDVLESMEKGTRPGVGQLVFYGKADDVLRADGMMSSE